MTKPKTETQRSASYKERMLAKGYVRLSVWVKKENETKLRKLADKLK